MTETPKKSHKRPRIVRQPDNTDPAQERGERIETGKMIARGGKSSGPVPGATPANPNQNP